MTKRNFDFQDFFRACCIMMIERLPHLPRMTEEERRIIKAEMDIIKLMQQMIVCGAKTRQGTMCCRRPMAGKRRCGLHGGKATGPRTEAGKQRVAEASRVRMIDHWECKKMPRERL